MVSRKGNKSLRKKFEVSWMVSDSQAILEQTSSTQVHGARSEGSRNGSSRLQDGNGAFEG